MDAAGTLRAEFMGRGIAVLRRFRFQFAPWRRLDRAFENTQSPAVDHNRPDDIASHGFPRDAAKGFGQIMARPALTRINRPDLQHRDRCAGGVDADQCVRVRSTDTARNYLAQLLPERMM